ncbi:DUF3667 domain-containing protein [Janthinobacterium fluminis]|uniref:DUF3667 domain-containing protein n=1 Tax=Janthinobacterium fluminis TaxID=2987524 RepID=A0ABT5JYW9_9BURK|nr:DUF3667 domain-containing protein [Janthinobacterium fluminis]MDC8757241.1 DUF3667 domain-containing protein [Janthinobacterium fluminis]
MSIEAESIGALVTAGLAAGELEGDGGKAAGHAGARHGARCANCATPLGGHYCHACGQAAHVHRSLLHLGEEVLHGILHFDAKGWRTIPMLVAKPGQLTRRYVDGQRTRFVSPLGLFLFMMFFMFFVFSYTSGNIHMHAPSTGPEAAFRAKIGEEMARHKAQINNAEAALEQARLAGADTAKARGKLDEQRAELAMNERILREFNGHPAKKTAATQEEERRDWSGILTTDDPTIGLPLKQALKNPDLMLYKLKNTAYKFSFVLVPITLPFLWLMFIRRRDITMYDHAVFALYSLCFMSLLFSALALLTSFDLDRLLLALLFIAPPLHMYAQLRDTYGIGRRAALWRTALLLCVVSTVFLAFLALITVLSVK